MSELRTKAQIEQHMQRFAEFGLLRMPENGSPAALEHDLFLRAAIRWEGEPSDTQPNRVFGFGHPPGFLYHIEQVRVVATSIYDHPQTHKLALTHDEGRTIDFGPNHAFIGAKLLGTMGYNGPAHFAVDHHRMGLGLPIAGRKSLGSVAREYYTGESNEDPLVKIHEEYGLPGLAVLVADVSKHVRDKATYIPEIVPFTPELAKELIQDQYRRHNENPKKGFALGSVRDRMERYGQQNNMRIIEMLGDQFGIDYHDAVRKAQQQWRTEFGRVGQLWDQAVDEKYRILEQGGVENLQELLQAA